MNWPESVFYSMAALSSAWFAIKFLEWWLGFMKWMCK